MSNAIVITEEKGAVAIVTLNRPETLNALNRELRNKLAETFERLKHRDDIRVVILTGTGRAFTSGIDLKEAGQKGFIPSRQEVSTNLAKVLADYPWPIIGAINGFAITGGFELALMCDVLIASTEAKFADTHARVGIMPGWGLSQRLPRMIGISRAKQVSLTGNFVTAEVAERWGLVNSVHSPEELIPAALKIAEDMASCQPHMLKAYKRVIDEGFGMSFSEALIMESKRSAEQSSSVSKESVEAARKEVTARGKKQQSN
ncbi:MAG: enoyl-CoA hydratase [Candidatus Azotimanducaceae bacterium]|jgi:enoyl-CoA hydratase